VIFKPFRVDDIIEVGEFMGEVEDITLRHTIIRDFENRRVIIPNSNISAENIKNSSITDQRINKRIFFGISYDSDIELATKIIREEAEKHPSCQEWRTSKQIEQGEPKVYIRLVSFGDSSVNLRANVWAAGPIEAFEMECDLNKSVKKRFDAEGIEIPFPHRTLVYKNKPAS
jgi:small-conductance mechanosensitive channel